MVWSCFLRLMGGQPWPASSVVVHVGGIACFNGFARCWVGLISLGVSLCSTFKVNFRMRLFGPKSGGFEKKKTKYHFDSPVA